MDNAQQLAHYLLQIKAVKLNVKEPFTWTSGIKSPIYCDNRVVLSYPHIRTFVQQALVDLVQLHFPTTDILAGIATAGIAHGVLVADNLQKPYCYVRPEPKKHGMQNQIEGYMAPNSQVVLVEDLISTGKSSLQAAQGVQKEGGIVQGLVALFTYGFQNANQAFAEQNIPFYTISNFKTLADVALQTNYIDAEDYEQINKFMLAPNNWM